MSPVGWSSVQWMLLEHLHGEQGHSQEQIPPFHRAIKHTEVVSAQTSLGEAVRPKETSTGTILQPHLDLLLRGGFGQSFPEPTDTFASTMSYSKELHGWAGRQWKTHLHQDKTLI